MRADGPVARSSSPADTTAIRCWTCRARSGRPSRRWSPATGRDRREPGVGHGEERRPGGRQPAAALREGARGGGHHRHDGSAGIGRADMERAIGVKVKYLLPSDYRRAVEALNSGQPVSMGNRSALAGFVPRNRPRPGGPAGVRRRAQDVGRLPRPPDRASQLKGRTDMVMTTTTPPAVDARAPAVPGRSTPAYARDS